MPVAINGVSGSMDIVTMDWYAGSAPANRPVLAISYKSGIILLMKNCNEEGKLHFTHTSLSRYLHTSGYKFLIIFWTLLQQYILV